MYMRVRVTVTKSRLRVSSVLVRVVTTVLVQNTVMEMEDWEVTDDELDSSCEERGSPAMVILVPVNPDASGWILGLTVWNGGHVG